MAGHSTSDESTYSGMRCHCEHSPVDKIYYSFCKYKSSTYDYEPDRNLVQDLGITWIVAVMSNEPRYHVLVSYTVKMMGAAEGEILVI